MGIHCPEDIFIAKNLSKHFPGVKALNDISLTIRAGEVHALIGENGAGKSTLLKIISGVYPPDTGGICYNGKEVRFKDPSSAQAAGISMVFQEHSLVPTLTIAENIFLAHEPMRKGGVYDKAKAESMAGELLASIGIALSPSTPVSRISVAQVQMISIARALSFHPKLLLLDEPTASLSENEIGVLFDLVRRLKEQKVGILYVSHRMEEIFKLADRVTVLRDGICAGTSDIGDTTLDELITRMVGRTIVNMYPKEIAPVGDEALRVEHLCRKGVCEDVNFSMRQGEVVGMFGLVGAGRTETARVLFGLDAKDSGDVYVFGNKVKKYTPAQLIRLGVGYLSEDRKQEGLCMPLSIRLNMLRASMRKFFPHGIKRVKREKAIVGEYVQKLAIATPSIEKAVSFLSGGTQQKVIIAHWMLTDPKVLILDEPTKGIDVGAKVEIYKMINRLTQSGVSILLISSDLPELMGISDRILVMYGGALTGSFDREQYNDEKIISYAIGVEKDA